MALRNGHGNGAGAVRIEVLPADELPAGVPGPSGPLASAVSALAPDVRRRPDGRVADAEAARELGRRGGLAAAAKARGEVELVQLAEGLGLDTAPAVAFARYKLAADEFHRHEVERLARTVGGGACGAGPASIVATAAIQRAASAYCYDVAAATGDADLFLKSSKLGNDSRQNLLAAHELTAREATARAKSVDPMAALDAKLDAITAQGST